MSVSFDKSKGRWRFYFDCTPAVGQRVRISRSLPKGCQKVGPGCDHCYAEARNARFSGGKPIDWQSGEPWPHRSDLAHALEWVEELSAMVMNLSERIPATSKGGAV